MTDVMVPALGESVSEATVSTWFKKPGDMVRTGERFGLIRFGSRLDVYLPEGVAPQVALWQTMVGGESVIAHIGQDTPARAARIE